MTSVNPHTKPIGLDLLVTQDSNPQPSLVQLSPLPPNNEKSNNPTQIRHPHNPSDDQEFDLGLTTLIVGGAVATGKFLLAAGSHIAYAAKAATWDSLVHPPKDFIDFIKNSKKEWQEEYADKNVKNPKLKFAFYKTLEVVFKFIIKIPESLILYPVAGIIGGLFGGKKGAKEGQKISGDVAEGLWQAACWVGRGISERVVQLGSSFSDTYKLIGADWKTFKGEWAETTGFLPTTAKVIEGLAHLPIKLLEYPLHLALGMTGAVIGGEILFGEITNDKDEVIKKGLTLKEVGQKLASGCGEVLWAATCHVGHCIEHGTRNVSVYELALHAKDDLDKWTDKRWTDVFKPISKIIEYPAYYLLGSIGGLIGGERGAKLGQGLAVKAGETVWNGLCAIGGRFKEFGLSFYDTGKKGVDDWKAFKGEWDASKGVLSKSSKVVEGALHLPIKIAEYGLHLILGAAGGLIGGETRFGEANAAKEVAGDRAIKDLGEEPLIGEENVQEQVSAGKTLREYGQSLAIGCSEAVWDRLKHGLLNITGIQVISHGITDFNDFVLLQLFDPKPTDIFKGVIKIIEYPAYYVLGSLGALIGGKEGAERGQKIAVKGGEALWEFTCWVAKKLEDVAVHTFYAGKAVLVDGFVHLGEDVQDFFIMASVDLRDAEMTARDSGEWSDRFAVAGTYALKTLEFFIKPLTAKLIEFPVYIAFGAIGGIVGGKEGAEKGQKIAKAIGKGIWDGICTVGRHVGYATKAALYDGFAHLTGDVHEFFVTAGKEWQSAKGIYQSTLFVISKPLEAIFKTLIFKPIEFAAYLPLGVLGGLIGGKEGAEKGQELAERIGKGLWEGACTIGTNFAYATKAFLYDGFVHIANDIQKFFDAAEKDLVEADKTAITSEKFIDKLAFAAVVPLKILEALVKIPTVKLIEYPAYVLFGAVGGIFGGKEGVEEGQKLAVKVGTNLWKGVCWIGNMVKEHTIEMGQSVLDTGKHIKDDWTAYKEETVVAYGKATNRFSKATFIIQKGVEILFKLPIKFLEYPLYASFGIQGAFFFGKGGKELGQQLAQWTGEGLWWAASKLADRMAATINLSIDLFEGAYNDFVTARTHIEELNTEWQRASGVQKAGIVVFEALNAVTRVSFVVTKLALSGGFGLVGAILGGSKAKEPAYDLSRILAYIGLYVPIRIINGFNKLMTDASTGKARTLSVEKTKHEECIAILQKSETGTWFLETFCKKNPVPVREIQEVEKNGMALGKAMEEAMRM